MCPTVLFVWMSGPSCRSYAVSFPLMTRTFCLAIGRLVCERVNVVLVQGHVPCVHVGFVMSTSGTTVLYGYCAEEVEVLVFCIRDFVPIAGDSTLTFLSRKEIILLLRSTEFMFIWFISRV